MFVQLAVDLSLWSQKWSLRNLGVTIEPLALRNLRRAVAIAPSLPRSWLVLGVMAATPIMRNETSSGFFNCQLIPVYIFTWPLEHWDMFQVWDGIINWIHHSDIYIRLWGEILWWDDPLNPPLRYLLLFVGNICVMEFYIYINKGW